MPRRRSLWPSSCSTVTHFHRSIKSAPRLKRTGVARDLGGPRCHRRGRQPGFRDWLGSRFDGAGRRCCRLLKIHGTRVRRRVSDDERQRDSAGSSKRGAWGGGGARSHGDRQRADGVGRERREHRGGDGGGTGLRRNCAGDELGGSGEADLCDRGGIESGAVPG